MEFWWSVAACLVVVLPGAAVAEPAATPGPGATPIAATELARQVLVSGDHARRPFAIVDKQAALIWVYHPGGSLAGVSAVLLGQTLGDTALPGVGDRAQTGRLVADDRTTPAGRFESEPGHNLRGESIVWIDYADALAIHRLRDGPARQDRARRLATPQAQDNRASAGCVIVPEAFYDAVVQPVLGRARGVVYVMPESGLSMAMWQSLTGVNAAVNAAGDAAGNAAMNAAMRGVEPRPWRTGARGSSAGG